MKNFLSFIKKLIIKIIQDDITSIANDMTYKLFFSIFPFVIFLMSVVGFLNLDSSYLLDFLNEALPLDVMTTINNFITEVVVQRNTTILSFSLIISVYGASSGFGTAMKGINKAYKSKDLRHFLTYIVIQMILVVIYAVVIIISVVLLILGDKILIFLRDYFEINAFFLAVIGVLRYIFAILILFVCVVLINKLALSKNVTVRSLYLGSFATVVLWIAITAVFNFIINKLVRFSAIYGSIAGIMMFLLWINFMSLALLIGSETNVCLQKSEE